MKLKIAFVGVAHWHAPIYAECLAPLDVSIVGSSDLDAEAGSAAAARLGLPFDRDAAAMLARTRPDFVFITPRHDRALDELAPVLAARLPFLIEKPMGLSGADAREVARRTRDAGLWAVSALPNRHLEIWDRFAALTAAGKLGRVMHASFRLINGPPERYRTMHHVPWMLDLALGGGGALRNLGVHGADAALRLAHGNPVKIVGARTTRHGFGETVDEYGTALVEFGEGIVAQIEAGYSWAPSDGGDFEWRIAATGAYLQQTRNRIVVRHADGAVEDRPTLMPSYAPLVAEALAAWSAGRAPVVSLAECAAAVELCDAIYEAARR
jgi:predicted dehydrogenase